MSLTLLILVGIVVLAVLYGVSIYNSLVLKRIGTENAWSQIDVQLKRRYDLIPNLVETVKGYASHEQDTLERVIQARSGAVSAASSGDIKQIAAADNMLTGALRQLFALSESYPELKANENFEQLHEEIVSTENKVSFARQHYNDAVAVFNAAIQQIPANFVASIAGMVAKQFFEVDADEKEAIKDAPKVSFD